MGKKISFTCYFNLTFMFSLLATSASLCMVASNSFDNLGYFSYTSDTFIDYQWAIDKIELNKAWKLSTGSNEIKVGVIDSGVDGTQEDLIDNIDYSLSNVFNQNLSSALVDAKPHGTCVAGIIGASGNNDIGISGVCWDVDLISLRVASDNGIGLKFEAIKEAIDYASLNNIPILNISVGAFKLFISDDEFNSLSNSIFNYPGLIVCAAGNDEIDLDSNLFAPNYQIFPACYLGNNIITVGNSDDEDTIYQDSNYGAVSVDLFAPGTNIYCTCPNDNYYSETGTSMAAPMVSGVAALLLSIDPTLTTSQLRSAILSGVDTINNLNNLCVTGGRLNAYKSALNVIPLISDNATPSSYLSSVTYPKLLRINCDATSHFSLSFTGPSNYRITLFTINQSTPFFSGVFTDSLDHEITFASKIEQEVFVKVENLSGTNGYFTANVTQIASHNYNSSYRFFNDYYHKSICECGLYILEPHIYSNFSSNCSICGILPLMNETELNEESDIILIESC